MRKVFIVGASSGIGKATAEKFVNGGDHVINMSRTPCLVTGVENIICDVSIHEELLGKMDELLLIMDKLDIFVYSAGFSMASPLEFVEEKDYRYLFEVNLFGFITALKKLIPILRKSSGTVCIVSSIGGVLPIPYDSYYSSSKAAVNMLVNALSLELMPKGIKIISVMPGGTKTEFSFKRKVYRADAVGDYALDKGSAAKKLEDMEQGGAKPTCVANTIYKACTKPMIAHTVASGFMNKVFVVLSKFLPQGLLYYINTKIYF